MIAMWDDARWTALLLALIFTAFAVVLAVRDASDRQDGPGARPTLVSVLWRHSRGGPARTVVMAAVTVLMAADSTAAARTHRSVSAGTASPAGITVPLGTTVTLEGEPGRRIEVTVRVLSPDVMMAHGHTYEEVMRSRAQRRQRVFWIRIRNLGPAPYYGEPKNVARVADRNGDWYVTDLKLTSIIDPRPDIGLLGPGAEAEKGVVFVVSEDANGQDRLRFALRPGVVAETVDWKLEQIPTP
jgi:uncharacterized membrane protein